MSARHVIACDLPATVDPSRLREAIRRVVRRHDILQSGLEPDFTRATLPATGGDEALRALFDAARQGPPAETSPQARFTLAQAAGRTQLIAALPPPQADVRSLVRLLIEIEASYRGERETPDESAPPQYRDVAAWLRDTREASAAAAGEAFWRGCLDGASWAAQLPIERRADASATARDGRCVWQLPASLREAAASRSGTKERGGDAAAWLTARLAAAATVWLAQQPGADTVAVGVRIDGRAYDALRDAVGPYDKRLPLVTRIHDSLTCAALTGAIVRQLEEMAAWQEWFEPTIVSGGLPACPLAVQVIAHGDVTTLDRGGWRLASVAEALDPATVLLSCELTAHGIEAHLDYASSIHAPGTIARLGLQLGAILEQLIASPQQRVRGLAFLSPDERAPRPEPQSDDVPPRESVPQRFERVACAVPDAIALVDEDRHVSYACLDRMAGRLAAQLRASTRTGPDVRIGLRVTSLADAPLAMLAIMKTGSAYVPLDPAWPAERPALVLHDAGIQAIVASAAPADDTSIVSIGAESSPAIVTCDAPALWRRASPAVRAGNADPEALAYVLYTSGTTGRPKGAMITHGGLANYLRWAVEAYEIEAGRGAIVQSPVTFDFTITTLLAPLMAGRCVFTCRQDAPIDRLAERLAEIGDAGVVKLTPSAIEPLWRLLSASRAGCRIGHLVIGGEALSASRALWALADATGAVVVNEYGPTECVVGSVVFRLAPRARMDGAIPIGRPIAHTRLDVEKRSGVPAETWIDGELFIGGAGVARGYLNRPASTAAAFVPDPAQPGARRYRTGDIVRALTSGDLVFVGRRDTQVKIRGHRIELAEVEQAIRRHASVADVAMLAWPGPDGRARLAAGVVPLPQAEVTPAALRTHLAAILPEPAIPSIVHMLDALPLTANGKTDLAALREMMARAAIAEAPKVAPRTQAERTLHRLWCDVLGRDAVGIDDHFFELGGDSIVSIQLLARANQAGLRLRPRDMRDHPTIRELAEIAGRPDRQAAPLPRVDSSAATRTLPLGPMQARFFDQRLEEPGHANQSLLLAIPKAWTATIVARALEAIAASHEQLRVSFEPDGASWRARLNAVSTPVPLSTVDVSADDEAEAGRRVEAAALAAQRGMTLDSPPLMRALFIATAAPDEHQLYLVLHHLIVDHVSWTVLVDDLRTACEQAARDEPIRLAPESAPYAAWVEQLRTRARQADSLGRARTYWLGDRWARVPRLPLDDRDPIADNRVEDEERHIVALERHETAELLHEAHTAYHTRVLDLLVTAYALAFVRWSGARALTIELEHHGRDAGGDELDVSRTIGWFTSLYPVYLTLTAPGDMRRSVQETKAALRAVPDEGATYGVLRYGEDAPLAGTPAPEVVFNYVGDLSHAAPAGGPVRWIPSSPAPNRSPRHRRGHLLDVAAYITGGALQVTFTYGRRLHRPSSVERLGELFLEQLRAVIDHCCAQVETVPTPSDFPLARLTQDRLDAIVAAHEAVEDIYALSPTQQGILFHATRRGSDRSYLVQLCAVVSGPLDQTLLEGSWQHVIRRHAALRTAFLWESVDEPLQVVARRADPAFVVEDWRGGPETATRARLASWLDAQRAAGLDLTHAPLHRFARFIVADDRSIIVWTYHHLLLDGWSTSNVLREMLLVYDALASGEMPQLPPARPYRDYIAWLAARSPDDARAYWRRQLSDVTAGTRLAVRRAPRAPDETAARAHADETWPLPTQVSSQVASLARRRRVTVNAIVQAAWAMVLSRYTGQDDVLFGVTVSGRPYDLPDVEHRVGLFINTLPMRVRVDRAMALDAYLDGVNARVQDMLEHGYLPLVEIQRQCDLPAREPMFDSIVVFENYPMTFEFGSQRDRLRVDDMWSTEQTNYPLTLVVGGADDALAVKALYDPAYVERPIVRGMLERFADVLRWMATSEAAAVCDACDAACDGARDAGMARLLPLAPARQTYHSSAWARPIHRLFEAHAAAAPDAVAVVDARQCVTYGDLNRRANRLAREIGARGAAPGSYVGVCVERSAEMIVAMLAVLKAGAAYVPIDTHFPARRIELLAGQTMLTIIDRETRRQLSSEVGCALVDIDEAGDAIDAAAGANLSIDVPLGQPAYLMFTSGSSGQPKGTLVAHGQVTRLFAAAFDVYPEQAGGVWSCFHSIAFDFSVWEIFGALLTGGRVVMASHWLARAPDAFAALVRREAVTMLSQTPSAFQQLLAVGGLLADPAPMAWRWVVFGGEALHMAPLQPFGDELERRGVRLINMYGITETTVHVTHRAMDDYRTLGEGSYIGQPLPDLRIHLLDRHGRRVPEGVAGEIHVAGDGVAIGYAGTPRLTAERFVPDPFADAPGGRLYRSGDLARAAGHELLYLGRGDGQVKIRGFRVELEEVRRCLLRCAGVRDAIVRAVEDHAGDRVLAAYVVPADPTLVAADLWPVLREHLPAHMRPSTIRLLDAFPLTGNGKIDLAALPAGATPAGELQGFVPPGTWEEELIADVWRDVLGLPRVGLHDDFFIAGGDSIKALRLVGRLKALGFDTTVEMVFVHPTVAGLSRAAAGEDRASRFEPAVPDALSRELARLRERLPDSVVDAYPLTQLQLGMLYHSAGADKGAGSDGSAGSDEGAGSDRDAGCDLGGPDGSFVPYHNVSTFRIQGPFHESRFRAALQALTAAHPALRTAFELDAYGMPVQVVHRSVMPAITIESLAGRPEEEQRARIDAWRQAEKRRFFTYDVPPLIRWHVADCGSDGFYLGMTEHHAILDGWSVASLLTALFQLYQDGASDTPAPVPYTPDANLSRTHALMERAALECPLHRRFWSSYLRDADPLRLPATSREAPAQTGVRKTQVRLDDAVTRELKALAHDLRVPLKSVLLSAHLAVLGVISNQVSIMTGLVTHGRPDAEGAESSLGLFLNTLPLRVQQRPVSWRDWIASTFEAEKQVLPYRRYPFAAMRDGAGCRPRLASAFNFVNFHVYERLSDEIALRVLEGEVLEETDFDLLTDFTLLTRTGELDLTLACNRSRIDDAQAGRIAEVYVRCLHTMVADRHACVTDDWAADPREAARHLSVPDLTAAMRPVVLDQWSRPTPVGTIGEICVPERTGEAGRLMPDGTIQPCGRADGRLEIDGYLIAPDEVRDVLREQPGIVDAIVSEGEHQRRSVLRAHVVAPDGVDLDRLRASLESRLPPYARPTLIIPIASLPLTDEGLPDHAALPASDKAAAAGSESASAEEVGSDSHAGAAEVDAALRELWEEILPSGAGLERRDEFLEIGGNSILLLQLQFKIHARFGLNVSLATLTVHGSFDRMSGLVLQLLSRKTAAPAASAGR